MSYDYPFRVREHIEAFPIDGQDFKVSLYEVTDVERANHHSYWPVANYYACGIPHGLFGFAYSYDLYIEIYQLNPLVDEGDWFRMQVHCTYSEWTDVLHQFPEYGTKEEAYASIPGWINAAKAAIHKRMAG